GVTGDKSQSGSLMSGWLAEFHYRVFTYEYPSVDADGKQVILSSIAACPEKGECSQVRDIVIGTHITICSNNECPTNCTNNYKESDWGVLFSLAGGPKLKLGWKANLVLSAATIFSLPIGASIWAGVGITAEVKSAEPSNNYNLVIMPDYEGYGSTKNRAHPYLYQELTARQVVDGVRYGRALYENDEKTKDFRHPLRSDFRTISCGYSQGGSVAMATHRFIEQNNLVDEFHFVGSLCGDGPYDPMATLMYYMQKDIEGNYMSMPVVLPLIVKGMLDSNPYMRAHKANEYFTQEFLDTGVMDWIATKQFTTDDIDKKWQELAKNGQTTVFDTNGRARMRDIMNTECYNYFRNLYDQYQSTYMTTGIPLPAHRGVIEDLHFALASNDMTEGWTPKHALLLFHSNSDNVVPYVNAQRAKANLKSWAVLHTSQLGHDHVDAGTDFFKADETIDVAKNFSIRAYIAKKKLCDLSWNGQTTSNIPTSW
ncbi:MAG: hypothetical protein IK092_02055, partial [Muribaculaceae bacterium]|nr:hypothetical protein [Muribaculaceae bacterium]